MVALISLLVVLSLSLLLTRVATVALTLTGLSRQSARFQARSALSGVGFATHESEKVVNHPVRRRIIMLLMLLGHAGVVTAVASLILTFVNVQGAGSVTIRVVALAAGLAALWGIATSQWVDRHLSNLVTHLLKRYTRLEVRDYAALLHLAGEYRISELKVEQDSWLAAGSLEELRLQDEGVMVLGITRQSGEFVGAPHGKMRLAPGDVALLYGRARSFEDLSRRPAGQAGWNDHRMAVADQARRTQRPDKMERQG
jgi:hypothetical protein